MAMDARADMPPREPDARKWILVVSALCVLVALGGGFTAGWVAHDRSQAADFREQIANAAQAAEQQSTCILDVLIEPEGAGPGELTFDDWVTARLETECGITRARARRILD